MKRSQSSHPLPTAAAIAQQALGSVVTEVRECDVADAAAVEAAARDVEALVCCFVMRHHPRLSFDVNVRGTYNAIEAAVRHGHRRFVNTWPGATIAGPSYRDLCFDITEDVPPQPGLGLYGFTKGLGQEILRVFAANHPIHVM